MASTMLNRMKETVDNILGQSRLAFVKVAHVVNKFSLYAIIIENVKARDRSIYISFIDFRKTFRAPTGYSDVRDPDHP